MNYNFAPNPKLISTWNKLWTNPFEDQSVWLLLISNLIAAYFALTQGWSAVSVMLLYWFQSVIIGIVNFIRILDLKDYSVEGFKINHVQAEKTVETKIKTAFFFLFHYGFFHFGYLIFIHTAFFEEEIKEILLLSLVFFINHLFSFFYNRPKDPRNQNIGHVMMYPYARIIPMHLSMFFLGFLPVFLTLKITSDVVMHIAEHKLFRNNIQI